MQQIPYSFLVIDDIFKFCIYIWHHYINYRNKILPVPFWYFKKLKVYGDRTHNCSYALLNSTYTIIISSVFPTYCQCFVICFKWSYFHVVHCCTWSDFVLVIFCCFSVLANLHNWNLNFCLSIFFVYKYFVFHCQ